MLEINSLNTIYGITAPEGHHSICVEYCVL